VEEVLRGKALTVIEIAGLAMRDYCLLQPDPGQHDVADGLEIHRRVGQRGAGGAADLALQAFATLSPGRPYWLELGERTVSVLSRAQRANDTIAVTDRLWPPLMTSIVAAIGGAAPIAQLLGVVALLDDDPL
jgi:hypothetical protein